MMNTVSQRRTTVAIIVAAVAILLASGGIIAARLLAHAHEPASSASQPPAMSANPDSTPPPTSTPAISTPPPPIANLPVPASFTEDVITAIEANGGYRVVGSPISDALLVAEDGAVPILWEQRTWGEWVDEEGGTSRSEGQTPDFVELSNDIMEVASTHPDNLSEAAYSSHDTFLEVYAKDTEGAGIADIAKLVENRGLAGKVVIVRVPYSASEMEAAQEAIMNAWEGDMGSMSADYSLGKILFSVRTPAAEGKILARSTNRELSVGELIATATKSSAAQPLDIRLADIPVRIEPYEPISFQ